MDSKQHWKLKKQCKECLVLIWIRALLSAAAEIKTLEGREMLVSSNFWFGFV